MGSKKSNEKLTYDQIDWCLAGDTSGFGNVADGRPFWIGNFIVPGKTDILFYYPGQMVWWLGSMFSSSKMLMVENGSLSAPYIDPYNLRGKDFTATIMVQPTSHGTIISTGSFELSLYSDGAIGLNVFGSTAANSKGVKTVVTNVINSKQCHIIACFVVDGQTPTIWLDGQALSATDITVSNVPESQQAILIANNSAGNNQYKGGIMNIGLWSRVLQEREATLSGYGQINELGMGPVAYWYLNNSLADKSINNNDLQLASGTDNFMPCFDCISLYGPNSYSFCQIDGLFQPGQTETIEYTQTVRVDKDAGALLGSIVDNSGYARFPEGVFVTITDPNGTIYNQDRNPDNGSSFVKTHKVDGQDTNSLFTLLVIHPIEGTWRISISAPSNIIFTFRMQAFPSQDIVQSHFEAFQDVGSGRMRRAETQSWSPWHLIVAAVVVVAAGSGSVASLATATGILVVNAFTTPLPIAEVQVTVNPGSTNIRNAIVNNLQAKWGDQNGKLWASGKGTLNTDWILQSGTAAEETKVKQAFNSIVSSAQTSIDILMFGDLSGEFLTCIKNQIAKNRTKELVIRIFAGFSPDIGLSSFVNSNGSRMLKMERNRVFFDIIAQNFAQSLISGSEIPEYANIFVGAGAIYNRILLETFILPKGWNHHKILIVDGKKAIIGGMNFSQDSLNASTTREGETPVNDVSAKVEGDSVNGIQKFINSFWTELMNETYSINEIDQSPFYGKSFYPEHPSERSHNFAIITSQSYDNMSTAISNLNSSVFTLNASGGDLNIVTAGRRSGYKFSENEPSDLAILDLIKNTKSILCLSQQAIFYPTNSVRNYWEEALSQIRIALNRGVFVKILVSWDYIKEGPRGRTLEGGYSSDYALKIKQKILAQGVRGDRLEVRNYTARNHAKVVIADDKAFYMGSQNIYGTKMSTWSAREALDQIHQLYPGIITDPVAILSILAVKAGKAIAPEWLKLTYEVGLGECGILVFDEGKTEDLIASYWTPKWDTAG